MSGPGFFTQCKRFLPLAAVLLLVTSLATAEIWRYVDENGTTVYTDSLNNIPPEDRSKAREISEELEIDETAPQAIPRSTTSDSESDSESEASAPPGFDEDMMEELTKAMGENLTPGLIAQMGAFVVVFFLIFFCIAAALDAVVVKYAAGIITSREVRYLEGLKFEGVYYAAYIALVVVYIVILSLQGKSLMDSLANPNAGSGASLLVDFVLRASVAKQVFRLETSHCIYVALLDWAIWIGVVIALGIFGVFVGLCVG